MTNEYHHLLKFNSFSNHNNIPTLPRLMSNQKDNDDLLPKILLSLSFFFLIRIAKWMFSKGWFNRFL